MKKLIALLAALLMLVTAAGAVEVDAPSALLMEKEKITRAEFEALFPTFYPQPEEMTADGYSS